MGLKRAVEILSTGLVTPVGLTSRSTAASVRAGITRLRESSFYNGEADPLILGFLDEQYLPPLNASLTDVAGLPERYVRMLRLATLALQEAARPCEKPTALLLGLPEPAGSELFDVDLFQTRFLRHLGEQAGVRLDLSRSKVLRHGRAGGLLALEKALQLLDTERPPYVLVGGVDTYVDFERLAELEQEQRLHTTNGVSDGFVPGEGAAFLLLGHPGAHERMGLNPIARINAIGTGHEQGHRYSTHPHLGDGLADAFRMLASALPPDFPKVRCVYAGLNGESFWAKDWGVAYLRNARLFADEFRIEHPVENLGDPGAALGPLLAVLAAIGLQRGYRESPTLVWCISDRGDCGAAMVSALQH